MTLMIMVVVVERYTCKTVPMVTVTTLPSIMYTLKVMLQVPMVVLLTGMKELTMDLLKMVYSSTTLLDVVVVQSSGMVIMVLSYTQNSMAIRHWV